MPIQLNERLPILEIDQDCIVSRRGDVSAVYEVFKPELFSLSKEELAAQQAAWIKAINTLPYNSVLTIQDWYVQANYQPPAHDPEQELSYLSRESDRYFHERPYFQHRCFLILTYRFSDAKRVNSALSSLLSRSLVPDAASRVYQIAEFKVQCERCVYQLTANSTIRVQSLKGEDLAGTKERRGLLEQYLQLTGPDGEGCLQDIDFSDSIRVGNKTSYLYTIADAEHLPLECSPLGKYAPFSTDRTPFPIGFATPMGPLLPVDHIYSQYLFIEDPAVKHKKLEIKRRRLQSLASAGRENGVTQEAVTQYLDAAAKGEQRPVKAHFNLLAWTEDPTTKGSLQNQVITAITRTGAVAHLETIGAPQIWWAGLPGNAADLPENETFDTFAEQAACFFIPESNGMSSKSPFGIRLGDRATGIPLHVDISDEPMKQGKITNRNKFIMGGSGSGKSFNTNHLVRSYYDQGAHIVIADLGGSYDGLCNLLGGKYYEYNEQTPLSFNPFRLTGGEMADTEKRENLKALLLVLWKKSDEPYGRTDYVALSSILSEYYNYLKTAPAVFSCFDTFYEWLNKIRKAPGTSTFQENTFDLGNFLYVVRPYYKGGEFDQLLNARDELNLLDERLIVFELDKIKDHPVLFPVVTIMIMDVFIGKMRRLQGTRKVIILEEAWKPLMTEVGAQAIRYLFKTVRKYFGEAIAVSQDIEDIVSNPIVKNTIINNADCKILLDQSKFMNRFDQIQELLGLSEKDKTLVLSLNRANDPEHKYKEVFISLGPGHSRVYRTEVSLEEYLVYTTEEKEKVLVKEYQKRYKSMKWGISMLAADIKTGAVRLLFAFALAALFFLMPNGRASAQLIDAATEIIKAALEQADLKIQQAQTQTLLLQNAQKALENTMAGDLLDDIAGWAQQQDQLFAEYYQELWEVKTVFSTYGRLTQLIQRQTQLVRDYQQVTATIQKDPHFSSSEVAQILTVYSGILDASIRNVGQLTLVIQSFVTQMNDADRLRLIDQTAAGIDRNYADLRDYSQQNTLLSLQRAKDQADIQTIKALYNIP
jgi:conjugation system TraG family ATPase